MPSQAPPGTDQLVLQALLSASDKPLHGLTKVQKLLFIAAHPKEFDLSVKRPIQSLKFKVTKHGPFSEEVYKSLIRLHTAGQVKHTERNLSTLPPDLADPDLEDERAGPRMLHVYETAPGAAVERTETDEFDLRLVKEAAKKWGWLSPCQIEDFVNRRVGLTPDLKERFFNAPWEDFVKHGSSEVRRGTPEPTEAFWRAEQAFHKERAKLIATEGEGNFAAYLDGERVGVGPDDAKLYDEVAKAKGRPPDFIGSINDRGVRDTVAPPVA